MRWLTWSSFGLLASFLLVSCGGDKATNPDGSGETVILGTDPA